MGTTQQHILNLLETKFDYQSARNVLTNWQKAHTIKSLPTELDDEMLAQLVSYLKTEHAEHTALIGKVEALVLKATPAKSQSAQPNKEQKAEKQEKQEDKAEEKKSKEPNDKKAQKNKKKKKS